MSKDELIRKLKKLKEHEQSAREIGNIEEAELYAEKVSELCLRHKITTLEVDLECLNREDPIDKETVIPQGVEDKHWNGKTYTRAKWKRVKWTEDLADVVANAHFCEILICPGTNKIVFIGRESDRAVAIYLYLYLVRTIADFAQKGYDEMYEKHYRPGYGLDYEFRGWKSGFYEGVNLELARRFRRKREEIKHEVGEAKFALVKISDKLVTDFMKKRSSGTSDCLGGDSWSDQGFSTGRDFGKNISLREGVGSHRGVKGHLNGK